MSGTPLGQRESAKAERRNAILDAALELVGRSGADHASIEAIAREAGVAPATVYNLFGTRDAILVGLLQRFVADLVARVPLSDVQVRHPLGPLLGTIDLLCELLGERPQAWRHIIVKLGDISANPAAGVSSGRDIASVISTLWQHLQAERVIQPVFPAAALGLQSYTMLNGALMRWAVGRIDLDVLRLLLHHSILAIATATATKEHSASLARDLRRTSEQLAIAIEHREPPTESGR